MNTYTINSLSDKEVRELKELYNHHEKRRVRQRAHMVLLSNQGYIITEVAKIVGVCRHTVSKHIHAYEKRGIKALYDKEIPGRPPVLNAEEQQKVAKWLDRTPRDVGYQQSRWTMKLLSHHIYRTFGKRLSEERTRMLAHKLDFSLVRPRQFNREADEEEREKAGVVLKLFQRMARWGLIHLFYQDEAKVTRLPTIIGAWTRKGTQKQIPIIDDHKYFYVYGAFNPIDGQAHYRLHPKLEGKGFRPFVDQLKRYYHQRKAPLVMVLDNASAHGYRGKHGLVQVEKGLYFYFLPSYSPDLNLAERLWKDLRKRVTHNFFFEKWEELKEAARCYMRYLQTMRKRVISTMGVL